MLHGVTTRAEALAAFDRCSNAGRWGADDERGTLNLITPEKRRAAARLVVEGVPVSLGADLDTEQRALTPHPVRHTVGTERDLPFALQDTLWLEVHGTGTHLDALGHVYLDGAGYNGRRQDDVVTEAGLVANDVRALSDGIFTRGVLLDVAAAAGVPWFAPERFVTPDDLEAAEALAGVRVEPGDAVVVHTGLERRAGAGHRDDLVTRAGLDLASVLWLRDRDVAVFSGDCVERLAGGDAVLELPLHQIGIVAAGLVLLEWVALTDLLATCARLRRAEFLLTAAPLRIPHASGSPVNPVALF